MPGTAFESLEQSASTSCKRRSKSLVSIARTKVSTAAAIVAASPGVIMPPASAEGTAFIVSAISAALSIVGRMRSIQSRIAAERQLDSLAGQGLGLAREQCRGGDGRLVAAADPAPEGIARPALLKGSPAHPPWRFW